MAAMQGANMIGADSRCSGNGSSSLFAFIKVSQPTDDFGSPSFLKSLKTANGAGIEPIDSLQKLFDAERSCLLDLTSINKRAKSENEIQVFPVPASDRITIKVRNSNKPVRMILCNMLSEKVEEYSFTKEIQIEISHLERGIYFLELEINDQILLRKISIQ
jgi:hypothetical protein